MTGRHTHNTCTSVKCSAGTADPVKSCFEYFKTVTRRYRSLIGMSLVLICSALISSIVAA